MKYYLFVINKFIMIYLLRKNDRKKQYNFFFIILLYVYNIKTIKLWIILNKFLLIYHK